jgi:Sec-independent protein translocase protein TatA
MGLMNFVWTAVFVGSAAYIARKDLGKVFRILKKPAENFVKDVKAEMEAQGTKQLAQGNPAEKATHTAAVPPSTEANSKTSSSSQELR